MRALILTIAIAACTPYDPTLPAQPFLCGQSDPKCPDGFECTGTDAMNRMICQSSAGTTPGVDAHISGFLCADDSAIEGPNKNDTVGTAWQTPVAQSKTNFPLAGLSICPDGDKDTYEITVTAEGQNLAADVEYQADGAALSVIILNSGGTAISSSQPNGTDKVHTSVPNLAIGSSPYYVQVYGPAVGKNNYKVTFNVTGP